MRKALIRFCVLVSGEGAGKDRKTGKETYWGGLEKGGMIKTHHATY